MTSPQRGASLEGHILAKWVLRKLREEPAERIIELDGLVGDAAPSSLPQQLVRDER